MSIDIPQNAAKILNRLSELGYEAYVVGGCVRDAILGRQPEDWDITTSAKPEQVKAAFRATVDTGIQHGTVTVLIEGESYEVTTYRIDGKYEDSRHPSQVAFTASLKEDLRRRDFTINAMAYHPDCGLVDLYGGMEDLTARRIRCVGDAKERFGEDALRILRALRFASQLDFDIEWETWQAIEMLAGTLKKISAERIQKELTLLLLGKRCGRIRDAWRGGVTKVVLPELDAMMEVGQNNPYHVYTVGEHSIRSMEYAKNQMEYAKKEPVQKGALGWHWPKKEQIILQWTMLLHDIAKPQTHTTDEQGIDHFYGHAQMSAQMARHILRRLKFDNETCNTVTKLIRYHDYRPELTERAMRHAIHKVGEEFPLLLCVMEADMSAQSPMKRAEKQHYFIQLQKLYRQVLKKGNATSLRDLAVTGRDLLEIGIPQGKHIGEILDKLLEQVLDEPKRNTREGLLEDAKAWMRAEQNKT